MLSTAKLGNSFALLRTAYLCCAFTVLCSALPCLSYLRYSFAQLRNAMQFLCIAVKAVPVLCQDVPSYAMPLRIGKIHCPALLFRAWLGIASPLPFHASPLLLFSMPRLAFPLLLLAYQFLCRSIHCDDVPLQVIVLLSQSFADQLLAMRCLRLALPFTAFSLARLFRRLRPRGSGLCRSCATGPGPGNIRSPATREPASGPFRPYR